MEENNNSEKGSFRDIIEHLMKENSFLRSENEILQMQIDLYRSEKKVNEQRNLSYYSKLDHVLKIIATGLANYDNREFTDEYREQNFNDSESIKSIRHHLDEHRESQNDNSEQKNLLQSRNYEHREQLEEHRHQKEEQGIQMDAHKLLIDDNEQCPDDNEHSPDENAYLPDDNKITSNDRSKQENGNKDLSVLSMHDHNESERLPNENEELSASNINFIQSQIPPKKDNEEHKYDNEKMSASELKPINENDSSANNNVKPKNEIEDGINDNESSVNGNAFVINEYAKPVRDNTNSSKSFKKPDNDNGEHAGRNMKVDRYENTEYKEFVQVLYENLKVSFSKKYAKKMMDRYVREMIFLMNNRKVSLAELCTAMHTSVSTMMRDLAIFKRKGWVKYYGTTKFGYYRITDEGMKMGEERGVES